MERRAFLKTAAGATSLLLATRSLFTFAATTATNAWTLWTPWTL